ncbi:MAG: hypothetical protein PUP91_29680 [Rhizonema sp. PD37]|nr:hypothetical protein [Rhizonema sp. PD37]
MLKNGYGSLTQMPTNMQQATLAQRSKPIHTRVVSSTPTRLRLRVAPSHRQSGKMERITSALQAHPNINQVRTNVQNGTITIEQDGEKGSQENVFASLKDLGIIFGDIAEGKSDAAVEVSNAVVDLNKRVRVSTNGVVDLRFLFPLGLASLAVRQLIVKGIQLEIIPWYVLAWYAFDSFIKLHATSQIKSPSE